MKTLSASGRAVARILHGISSPAFPTFEWKSCPGWGRHKEVSFRDLMDLADGVIAKQRARHAGRG